VHGTIKKSFQKSADFVGIVRQVCVFFFALTFLSIAATSAFSQAEEPLYGVWRLDPNASTFLSGPPTYKTVTCKIEPWKDGLRVVYDMVGWRGGVTHWEWTGKLDGQDYALHGVDEMITNAYRRMDSRTYNVVSKLDGRVTTTTKIVIAADGKSMTVTSPVSTPQGQILINTAVYTKR
jgi:hypothetical protein